MEHKKIPVIRLGFLTHHFTVDAPHFFNTEKGYKSQIVVFSLPSCKLDYAFDTSNTQKYVIHTL